MTVSFIGAGNRRTRRKPSTCKTGRGYVVYGIKTTISCILTCYIYVPVFGVADFLSTGTAMVISSNLSLLV
jgi:hypothetical protein